VPGSGVYAQSRFLQVGPRRFWLSVGSNSEENGGADAVRFFESFRPGP
jgi:hypothetical protein